MELQSRLVRILTLFFSLALTALWFATAFSLGQSYWLAWFNLAAALAGFTLFARNRPGTSPTMRWLGPVILGGTLFVGGFVQLATSDYPFFGWCDLVIGACFLSIAIGVGLRFPVDEFSTGNHFEEIEPLQGAPGLDRSAEGERRTA